MKRLVLLLVVALVLVGCTTTPTSTSTQETKPTVSDTINATLHGRVSDTGQIVNKITIDLTEGITASNIDVETFKVQAVGSTEAIREGTDVESYGDYDIERTIVKTEVNDQFITLYLMENEGSTIAYLSSARNFPLDLTYTITQNKDIELDVAGEKIVKSDFIIDCDNTVVDDETSKFESVLVEGGINYQFYNAEGSDKLIVWFHGNGEGDYNSSNNNVVQMLGNRGTVAWASDEAQEIFGGANVMAFQAPDAWYYAQSDGLLEKAYNEINEVVQEYGIDPNKILVSGASAGGYMSTRMLIAYPDLFAVALINCPALDIATERGGETPTDEELASITSSKTQIWLVQSDNDTVVKTDDCSVRMFNILKGDSGVVEKTFEQDLDSNFTTQETEDGKYKLSLYETVMVEDKPMLEFSSDYDQDGTEELAQYSNHWSWIYTLKNNPKAVDDTNIWQWASQFIK